MGFGRWKEGAEKIDINIFPPVGQNVGSWDLRLVAGVGYGLAVNSFTVVNSSSTAKVPAEVNAITSPVRCSPV